MSPVVSICLPRRQTQSRGYEGAPRPPGQKVERQLRRERTQKPVPKRLDHSQENCERPPPNPRRCVRNPSAALRARLTGNVQVGSPTERSSSSSSALFSQSSTSRRPFNNSLISTNILRGPAL